MWGSPLLGRPRGSGNKLTKGPHIVDRRVSRNEIDRRQAKTSIKRKEGRNNRGHERTICGDAPLLRL